MSMTTPGTGKGSLLLIAALVSVIAQRPSFGREGKTTSPTLDAAFLHAVNVGNIAKVKKLLDRGVNINARDDRGNTALHLIACSDHHSLMILLLSKGIDANAQSRSGLTALMMASKFAMLKTMRRLLDHSADPNLRDEDGRTALMHLLWDEASAQTHRHFYSQEDKLEAVKLLLSKGAKAEDRDSKTRWTPLIYESTSLYFDLDYDIVALLASKGADVNAAGKYGSTALMYAALGSKDPRIVKLLLDKGADVNARDHNGTSAILNATHNLTPAQAEIFEILVGRGADINAQDNEGNTPLHFAAKFGKIDTLKIIMRHKPDVDATDKKGETPLEAAESNHHSKVIDKKRYDQVVEILTRAGARKRK
ncbi:MAG: ankyrin repeat domain-containing protein [Deltaproteobacteria bacterium]|nr:ankyrin repeat domain-containing protein [Deltaproteobacteria bacterium]